MALELLDAVAILAGEVTVDDAEPLTAWLRERPDATVDLRDCTHLHTAALQALLFFRPTLDGAPVDAFLARHVLPSLNPPPSARE